MKFRTNRFLAVIGAFVWLSACIPSTPLFTPSPKPTAQVLLTPEPPVPLQPGATIQFQKLSIEQGLSQSVVTAMAQDRTGFLWLGTTDGLNRYDGYNFSVYRSSPKDPGSLSDGWITALLADTDGSVWVGTRRGGLNRFEPQTGKFTRYENDPKNEVSLTAGPVTAIYRDQQSNLWIGTANGLNRFDLSTKTFTRFTKQDTQPSSLGDDMVTAIFQDSTGRLWIGTNKGLSLYDAGTGGFTHYTSTIDNPSTLSHDSISGIAEDHQGNVWIATKGGLNRLDPNTDKFVRYLNNPQESNSLGSDSINGLLVDSNGILWIATSAGLDRFDPARKRFSHYRNNPMLANSLSVDVVYCAFEDREGVLWFGTWGGGVNKYDPLQNQFAYYRNEPGNPESLRSGGIFPIFVDEDGTAWLGVYDNGLEHFDPATGVFTHFANDPANPGSLGGKDVWAILRDRQGVLWLGTNKGLDQFDEAGKKFIHHQHDDGDPKTISADTVSVLFEDAAGNLWVGTSKGLDRYDRASGEFIHYSNADDPKNATPIYVSHISEDGQGNLWISSTTMGLYYFNVNNATFKHFTYDPEAPNSVADNILLWTYVDLQNNVWIATGGGGLNKYDPSSDTFSQYTDEQGLANNFVYCVIPDDDGYLWMGTNHGLSRLDPAKGTFQNFTVEDGLQSNETNSYACARGSDGSLYFGGLNGFNHFSPRQVHASTYKPPIVLTALNRDGKPLSDGIPIEAVQNVTVKWPQNGFDFEFTSLAFSQPQRTQYAYMLDGFDTNWNILGSKRDGRYTNLPGGDYTLRLRATNRDGAWTEAAKPLHVTVVPPVWQMWWFIGLSGLLVAMGVFGAYRLRVRSVEAQRNELERQVKERTLEIERLFEQTKELAIIEERNRLARELHDSAKQKAFAALAQLGTAGGLIQNNAGAARTHISEAENLVYDVIQELTFLIQEMYPLALQEKGLAAALREYTFEWENRTDIRASVRIESERRLPLQAEQALYRISQEALANVARHSHASQVELRVTYEPESVTLLISDNGQGFDVSQKPKGLGLRSIQERAESVGGRACIDSAPGKGTRIEVTIAIKAAGAG